MIKPFMFLAAIVVLVSGCTINPNLQRSEQPLAKHLPTAYDYQLLNKDYQPVSLQQLAASVKDADVVFIGEYHRNQASHLLQMQLFEALHRLNQPRDRQMILAMEQFERQQQGIVDDYLSSKIGERYLINKAPTWGNYQGSYRPLVEYAKQHQMRVIAANAPGNIVRCIGRQGEAYLGKLKAEQKNLIAAQPFAEIPGYADKFFGFMGNSKHMASKRAKKSYQAQLTRDNTMAESIAKALKKSPKAQLVHLNGSFHSAGHLGAAGALKRMDPTLKIAVITPLHLDKLADFKKDTQRPDDFYYLLNRQPKEFVNTDYMKKSREAMFTKSRKKAKSCQ